MWKDNWKDKVDGQRVGNWTDKIGFWMGGIERGENTVFSAIASKNVPIDTPKIPPYFNSVWAGSP